MHQKIKNNVTVRPATLWERWTVSKAWMPHDEATGDYKMRRRVGGTIETRKPTPEEMHEISAWQAGR